MTAMTGAAVSCASSVAEFTTPDNFFCPVFYLVVNFTYHNRFRA